MSAPGWESVASEELRELLEGSSGPVRVMVDLDLPLAQPQPGRTRAQVLGMRVAAVNALLLPLVRDWEALGLRVQPYDTLGSALLVGEPEALKEALSKPGLLLAYPDVIPERGDE